MFKGIETQNLYEQCMERGLCQEHLSELIQDAHKIKCREFLRKAATFIRMNVMDPVYFKKISRHYASKTLLQRSNFFSECINGENIPVGTYDSILTLDSVAVFTLSHFSKICCLGALFKFLKTLKCDDPEIKYLYKLLHKESLRQDDMVELFPCLEKNFIGCDVRLVRCCLAHTLIFVRNVCIKENILSAVDSIETFIYGHPIWTKYTELANSLAEDESHKIHDYSNLALSLNSSCSPVLNEDAADFNQIERFKEAEMNSYVLVMMAPFFHGGYCCLATCLHTQERFKQAFQVVNYGLSICDKKEQLYEVLEDIKIISDISILVSFIDSKRGLLNNKSKIAVKGYDEINNFPDLIEASDSEESDSEKFPDLIDGSDSEEEITQIKQVNDSSKIKKNSTSKKEKENCEC